MQSDFKDAHHRHWKDAELLFQRSRYANADHLYGMAAECGLKSLMQAFGMDINSYDIPADKKDRAHVDKIWDRFESYRSGHHQGVNYSLPTGNPFHDWRVAQRYANESNFSSPGVNLHRAAAKKVRQLINQANADGLI